MKRRLTPIQVMNAAVVLAPPLTLGVLILVPYLQSRPHGPETLKDFIVRGIMEPPILHPGVVGTIVLAASVLLAEAPIAIAILAQSRRGLKLGAMTALVGTVWIGCVLALAQRPRSSDPEYVTKRLLEPDPRPSWQIAAEPWVLETGPGILFILLPIGVGGAWFLSLARRATFGAGRI